MSTDRPEIQYKKEAEVRVKSFGALHESTETENNNKNVESEEVQIDMLHDLPDWLQEFKENLVDESTSTEPWKPRAGKSRHFQFFWWTTNGVASKSGTGFG